MGNIRLQHKETTFLIELMTPEEFESAILSEDFKINWLEKETERYKHVELLE